MKRDFTYFRDWLVALVVSTLIWACVVGFVLTIAKMLFSSVTVQYLATWLVGTIVICVVLAVTAYRLGIRMNAGSTPISLDGPVLNQILGAVIYVVAFAVTQSYMLVPNTLMLACALWNQGKTMFHMDNISHSSLVWLCVLQVLIYIVASLGAYIFAKNRQDHHNETVRRLREERKKEQQSV